GRQGEAGGEPPDPLAAQARPSAPARVSDYAKGKRAQRDSFAPGPRRGPSMSGGEFTSPPRKTRAGGLGGAPTSTPAAQLKKCARLAEGTAQAGVEVQLPELAPAEPPQLVALHRRSRQCLLRGREHEIAQV